MKAATLESATPGDWFSKFGHLQTWDDRDFSSAEAAVARDVDLGRSVANGAAPTFRLWENSQALVVSRQDTRLPNFARAAEHLGKIGWPVITRETGGTAVAMSPGMLNLSLVLPRSLVTGATGYAMDTVYRLLCEPIQQALLGLGIPTQFASVPGAFCDGRFNLVTGGKKIAGTAQASRANIATSAKNSEGYVLAHAALLVDIDTHRLTDIINRFYKIAGSDARFSDKEVTSVRHCLEGAGAGTLTDEVRALVRSRIRNTENLGEELLPGAASTRIRRDARNPGRTVLFPDI